MCKWSLQMKSRNNKIIKINESTSCKLKHELVRSTSADCHYAKPLDVHTISKHNDNQLKNRTYIDQPLICYTKLNHRKMDQNHANAKLNEIKRKEKVYFNEQRNNIT